MLFHYRKTRLHYFREMERNRVSKRCTQHGWIKAQNPYASFNCRILEAQGDSLLVEVRFLLLCLDCKKAGTITGYAKSMALVRF